jgi:anti-anti-sigma factor
MSATREAFKPFRVDLEPWRDVVHVRPCGELDIATVGAVRERIDELLSAGFTRVLLDLRELTFLDSRGLCLILELLRSSEADGWEMTVLDGSPEIRRLFDLTGLRGHVPFVEPGSVR